MAALFPADALDFAFRTRTAKVTEPRSRSFALLNRESACTKLTLELKNVESLEHLFLVVQYANADFELFRILP